MARLTDAQLWQLSLSTFGPAMAPTMYGIAKAESGGNPAAVNTKGLDRSYGIWQVNIHPEANPDLARFDLSDPAQNAQAAKIVLERQGPGAWSAYTKGTYKSYVPSGGNMATGDEGKTEDELLAEYNGGSNFQAGNIPLGYTFDPGTGAYYRATADGSRVQVSMEEVQAASIAQASTARTIERSGASPGFQFDIDPRTGEGMIFNPATGAREGTGKQAGFAGIDPRESMQADQQAQAAERQLKARDQAIDLFKQAQNTLLEQARQSENAKVNRASLRSDEAKTNASLKENARQADLRAAVDQWQTAMNLIPALGQLSLDESKRVQDILSNGNDFLARAFESRGGTSPLAKVLQADQINAVSQSLGQLRGMVSDALAQSPVAKGGGFQPVDYTQMDGFAPADLSGTPQVPGYTDPGTYKPSAAPAIPQGTFTPQAAGGFTPDQDGGEGYVPPPTAPSIAVTAQPAPTVALTGDADMGVGGTAATPGWQPEPNQVSTVSGDPYVSGAPVMGGWSPYAKPVASATINPYAPKYAEGGFTTAPSFVAGDSLDPHPNPEIIENPTGAPIRVRSPRFGGMNVPHYATGTGYSWSPDGSFNTNAGIINGQSVAPAPTSTATSTTAQPNPSYRPSVTPAPAPVSNNPWTSVTAAPNRVGAALPAGVSWGSQDHIDWLTNAGRFAPVAPAARPAAPAVSQAELVRMARENSPPAVSALLAGNTPAPYQALKATDDSGGFLRTLTPRQLSGLDAQELKALGTRTNVEFNAPLEYVMGQTARQYGPSMQRRGGFVGALGI